MIWYIVPKRLSTSMNIYIVGLCEYVSIKMFSIVSSTCACFPFSELRIYILQKLFLLCFDRQIQINDIVFEVGE